MTLSAYQEWRKTTRTGCLRSGICLPVDLQVAYCRYGGAKSKLCDYHSCPLRRYYKTDGGCVVRQTNTDTELIFFHIPMTLTLSPDRVRFLGKALTELSEKLDAEKEAIA